MNLLRKGLPVVVLAALASAGCFLTSGQFVVQYDLPNAIFSSSGTFQGELVDLNTLDEYNDHKQDLARVEEVALVGDVQNLGDTDAQVEAWIVPDATSAPTGVTPNAIKLWGPFNVPAGTTAHVDWDQSAALFVGRQVLIDEIKGDGVFGLYLAAPSPQYDISTTNAAFITVFTAAK